MEERQSGDTTNGIQLSHGYTSEKDFVVCSNNGSDIASVKSLDEKSENSLDFGSVGRVYKSAHSSISSFSEVHGIDMEPRLGKTDHEDDVTTLMADAQQDVDAPSTQNLEEEDAKNDKGSENAADNSWMAKIRKFSEFDDIDPAEVHVTFDDASDASDEVTNNAVENNSCEESAKDACVLYHGITYFGSSCVNAPVSELELKRTISIMRDHANVSLDVILAVGLSLDGHIRLIDPQTRVDIALYDAKRIIFWGKADEESREKDCVAFNVSHDDETFQCHVFKCAEEDTVSIASFSDLYLILLNIHTTISTCNLLLHSKCP